MISFHFLSCEGYPLETISQGASKGAPALPMGPGPRGMQDRPWFVLVSVLFLMLEKSSSLQLRLTIEDDEEDNEFSYIHDD